MWHYKSVAGGPFDDPQWLLYSRCICFLGQWRSAYGSRLTFAIQLQALAATRPCSHVCSSCHFASVCSSCHFATMFVRQVNLPVFVLQVILLQCLFVRSFCHIVWSSGHFATAFVRHIILPQCLFVGSFCHNVCSSGHFSTMFVRQRCLAYIKALVAT